ncbi:hypothetical protein niasHT_027593 [Heterodera trifolii]|uniref:Major facilitator superfamily (MFS) profile domain-containing protein n=1 Tax=Heterodera trifolii TaxID=157864 RepID=A0ABD2K5Q0_9BILA
MDQSPKKAKAKQKKESQFEEISLDSRKGRREKTDEEESSREKSERKSSLLFLFGMDRSKLICVFVLFAINLLNYMDRFTIAGVLNDVQKFYHIDDKSAGFLQTVFIIFFMTIAPICGFLGDRFNRKRILLVGLSVWVGAVFASSFISENHFWAFLLFRGVVGIGEASYAVIAPTIIADLFVGQMRSRILMFFYFAIPVGSGLGYVIGSSATSLAKSALGSVDCPFCWQWGIRVTPLLGLFCIITLLLFVKEPVRGQSEQSVAQPMPTNYETGTISPSSRRTVASAEAEAPNENIWKEYYHRIRTHTKSYCADIGHLMANRTFVWSTLAYTAVVFVTGTLSW